MDMKDYALIEKETLRDIGDGIREKEGTTEDIPPKEMGDRIRAIAGALAEINGYKYTCGTVSFETDKMDYVKINHDDIGDIKTILLWCEAVTIEDTAYKVMAFYVPTVGTNSWNRSGSICYRENGDMMFGNPASAHTHGVYNVTRTSFEIGAGTVYGARLLAGKTYHWIVIGGGAQ